jgi:hypothetical protein
VIERRPHRRTGRSVHLDRDVVDDVRSLLQDRCHDLEVVVRRLAVGVDLHQRHLGAVIVEVREVSHHPRLVLLDELEVLVAQRHEPIESSRLDPVRGDEDERR